MNNIKELYKFSKNFTVLYVEDDKKIQNSMCRYLKKIFKSVDVADDGLHGLELYNKINPDIVITDLSMPKMNGTDLIKNIRKIKEKQSILVTTAHNEPSLIQDIKDHSIDGYIIKPFEFKNLNEELYKLIKNLNFKPTSI